MTRSLLRRIDDALCAFRFGHTRRDLARAERARERSERVRGSIHYSYAERSSPIPPDPFRYHWPHAVPGSSADDPPLPVPSAEDAAVEMAVWFHNRIKVLRAAGYIVHVDGEDRWCNPPMGRAGAAFQRQLLPQSEDGK